MNKKLTEDDFARLYHAVMLQDRETSLAWIKRWYENLQDCRCSMNRTVSSETKCLNCGKIVWTVTKMEDTGIPVPDWDCDSEPSE